MKSYLPVWLLLWATTLYAEPPVAIVNGPTTGTPGEIMYLDASGSYGEPTHFKWTVEPEIRGRRQMEPPTGNAARIQIASFPGTYRYTLIVSNADGADMLYWIVRIPGNVPPSPGPDPIPPPDPLPPEPTPPEPTPPQPDPPAPNPTPPNPNPPQPDPPQPDPPKPPNPDDLPFGKFGISRFVAAETLKITGADRAAKAEAVAKVFDSVASAIVAGGLNSAKEILDAIVEGNRTALGSPPPAEWIVWGKELSNRLASIYNSGVLKNSDDWSTLCLEIAQGLRFVTKQ